MQKIKAKIQKILNSLLSFPLKEKNNADRAHRADMNSITEAALRLFKRKIIPIQPKAEPIRLTL
ncbi:hypothetical protein HQ550_00890 [bacterium]|nr:hypothetical protein [bacterium]